MKFLACVLLCIDVLLLASCQKVESDAKDEDNLLMQESVQANASFTSNHHPSFNKAVCLWSKVGLRDKPGVGKDAKYLTTIYFGETVDWTGSFHEVDNENRVYAKVKLSDGSTGWVNKSLFAPGAELAVITQQTEAYYRPDIMTFSGKALERGDIIALLPLEEQHKEWIPFVGAEKKRKGWVQVNAGLSKDQIDLNVVSLYKKAMDITNYRSREKQLKMILDNSLYVTSTFIDLINEELDRLDARKQKLAQLNDDQLYITAPELNVRKKPNLEDDNVIFQLTEGSICEILRKGNKEEIGSMKDYWYKIQFNNKEGWIYGYHTSKRRN